MDNESYINYLKGTYESLRNFEINNNIITLKNENNTFKMPLNNVTLSSLNPNIFLLDPNEIFQILYVLELLYKESLSEDETNFVTQFTKKYLVFNDNIKENNSNDSLRVWCYSIPIFLAYDINFMNNYASKVIQEVINNHDEELESGRGHQKRLVLTNPQFKEIVEENYLPDYEKAGFTTIILIALTIISTCVYFAFFIFK